MVKAIEAVISSVIAWFTGIGYTFGITYDNQCVSSYPASCWPGAGTGTTADISGSILVPIGTGVSPRQPLLVDLGAAFLMAAFAYKRTIGLQGKEGLRMTE